MSVNPHKIIEKPIITEESQIQLAKANQYVFRVHPKANKAQIKAAVEAFFPDVKVTGVNTMNYSGKLRRQMTRRQVGRTAHWKKAIVTLRAGDSIELI
jgi:large subunit ribosomal protein L23